MASEPKKLRTLIVDDEAPARALLGEFLRAHDDIEVVGECMNGFEAVKRIGELEPDVVLLDIQMPKLDGFEVLELLEKPPAVVFITAYDEYALKAFEVHAVDYVLKPVGRERLADALQRVRERLASPVAAMRPRTPPAPTATSSSGATGSSSTPSQSDEDEPEDLPAASTGIVSPAVLAASARPPGQYVERILVKDGSNVHVIPIDRLDWLEAQDDYVAVRAEGKTHLKPQTLAEISAGLDPKRFVRIHRSYVLNVERLARLELLAKESRVAILKDGKELPVSRSGYVRLKELL